jgi:hypothetical protein
MRIRFMKSSARCMTATLIVALVFLFPFTVLSQVERHEIPLDNAVFLGSADAPITIIEFLDFQ